MPIEQTFETRDAAPEFLRSHLTEQDGKFVFKAELPDDTGGLKAALKTERTAREMAEKNLKGFEGIDPEKARKLLSDQQKAEEEIAKAKGDWDNWKAQMQEQHKTEKAALETQLKDANAAYETEFVDAKVTAEIATAKGKPLLLKPHIGAKSVIEEGQRVIRIFDAAGKVRYGKDGAPMTVAERLAEMKKQPDFMPAFEGKNVGGGGAETHTNGGIVGSFTLSREQARDTATYRRTKEAAEKVGQTVTIAQD